MNATPHLGFIVGAYVAATAIAGALIAWVILDYRALRQTLAEFEGRGVTRRSEQPAKETAKQPS